MNIEYARIVRHENYSDQYRLLVLKSSTASSIIPGQFIHLLIPNMDGSVLRRPFSIFRANKDNISILYKEVGRGTKTMTLMKQGDNVNIISPLGNGFRYNPRNIPIIIAGGYGVAPLSCLAEQIKAKGIAFIGGASKKDILCTEIFKSLNWDVFIATEDGSIGSRGLVTDILNNWLNKHSSSISPELYACGPDGMLKTVGNKAIAGGWKAWLSLDKHMGCGVGACLTCVQRIKKQDGTETWARVCKDGPVFESREIIW